MKKLLLVLISGWLALAPIRVSGQAADGYLTPEPSDGMVFPVARSDWYSVIGFGNDWHDPRFRKIDGRWQLVGRHEGNDIIAEPGTPILSVTGGYVEQMGWLFYSGWRIGIRGDDGRYWFYAHLRRYAPGLGEGDRVEAGTVLGEVGNTGYGNRPGHANEFTYHLHIGIQETDAEWVNPYPLLKDLYRAAVKG